MADCLLTVDSLCHYIIICLYPRGLGFSDFEIMIQQDDDNGKQELLGWNLSSASTVIADLAGTDAKAKSADKPNITGDKTSKSFLES